MNIPSDLQAPHVSVVLLTYNQKENTLECLSSFQSVTYSNMSIFLVDNASVDETVEAVKDVFPSVRILRSKINLGCGGGRNFGAQKAIEQYDSGYILFVDNDTVVEPDFINHLVRMADEHQHRGIVTAKILDYKDRDVIDAVGNRVSLFTGKTPNMGHGERDVGQYDSLVDLKAASGCCQLIPTDLWMELGGYDPDFNPYGYEDIDLCLRMRGIGKRILLASKARIYHKGTQTLGEGRYVSSYTKVKGKHMRRFLAKHAKLHHKVVFLFLAPFLAVGSILRAFRSGDPGAAFRMFSSFIFAHREENNGNADSIQKETDKVL